MIDLIKREKRLAAFCRYDIEDEGISAEIEHNLSDDEYIGVKVDDYFNSQGLGGNAPSRLTLWFLWIVHAVIMFCIY